MRLSFSPPLPPPSIPSLLPLLFRSVRSRDDLYGLICGDVKIAKINTELLTLNIQAIDWAGPSQTLIVRSPFAHDERNEKLIEKLRLD